MSYGGRLINAVWKTPGACDIDIFAAYFQCGIGLTRVSLEIMDAISRHAAKTGRPFIVGGDFNNGTADMGDSGWLQAMDAVVLA
eukprot:7126575-Karenia_brevis.AAC.1